MTTLLAGSAGLVLGAALGLAAGRLRRPRPPAPLPATAAPSDPQATGRSELISKISHELKNPIMSVKGLAATGSRLYDSLADEERRELFRLIDAEAGRLKLIAEETSTALKIDAGALVYDRSEVDLGRLVEETVWRTPVGDHPVTVNTEVGMTARLDGPRLAEAIANLVDNAAKFSPEGSPIRVTASRSGGGISIEVVDAGPGIPEERKPDVFERYGSWRPHGYEEVPGAGLGLYISRAHVIAHDGRLEVTDAGERGTILRVWLPTGG